MQQIVFLDCFVKDLHTLRFDVAFSNLSGSSTRVPLFVVIVFKRYSWWISRILVGNISQLAFYCTQMHLNIFMLRQSSYSSWFMSTLLHLLFQLLMIQLHIKTSYQAGQQNRRQAITFDYQSDSAQLCQAYVTSYKTHFMRHNLQIYAPQPQASRKNIYWSGANLNY